MTARQDTRGSRAGDPGWQEREEGGRNGIAFKKILCSWSAEILLAWLVGPPRSGPLSAVRPITFPKPKPTTHKPQGKPPNIKVSIATSAHMCHVRGAYIRPFWRVLVLVLGVFRCFRARGRFEMVRVGENQKEKTNSTLNHSHAVVAPHRGSSTHHTPLHHSKVHPRPKPRTSARWEMRKSAPQASDQGQPRGSRRRL